MLRAAAVRNILSTVILLLLLLHGRSARTLARNRPARTTGGPSFAISKNAPEPIRLTLIPNHLHYCVEVQFGPLSQAKRRILLLDTASSDVVVLKEPQSNRITTSIPPVVLKAYHKHSLHVDNSVVSYTSLEILQPQLSVEVDTFNSSNGNNNSQRFSNTAGGSTGNATAQSRLILNKSVTIRSSEVSFVSGYGSLILNGWSNSSGVFGIGFPSVHDITQAYLSTIRDSSKIEDALSKVEANTTYSKPGFKGEIVVASDISSSSWTELLSVAALSNVRQSERNDAHVPYTFTLDFAGDAVGDGIPALYLGGIPSSVRSKMQYAEYMTFSPPSPSTSYASTSRWFKSREALLVSAYAFRQTNYRFRMHDPRFCGATFTSNFSSSWPVLLDSGAACLGLPSNMMDAVRNWLGDSVMELGKDTWLVITALEKLPVLTFRLKQNAVNFVGLQSEAHDHDDNYLYIPLSSLVYTGSSYLPPQLCIIRTPEPNTLDPMEKTLGFSASQKIIFGTLVMKNFVFAVDARRGRLALANTNAALDSVRAHYELENSTDGGSNRRLGCAASALPCKGDDLYIEIENRCVKPNCEVFLFHSLDEETHRCEWESGAVTTFYVALISIAILDLYAVGVNRRLRYLTKSAFKVESDSAQASDRGDSEDFNISSDGSNSEVNAAGGPLGLQFERELIYDYAYGDVEMVSSLRRASRSLASAPPIPPSRPARPTSAGETKG